MTITTKNPIVTTETTTATKPLLTTETTTTAARFTNRIPILPIGTESATRAPRKHDYVIYGILSNNSVVEKTPNDNYYGTTTDRQPRQLYRSTESNLIVYGIYPNNTVVRKYPNGTIVQEKQLNENIKLSNYSPENIITELQKQSVKNQQKQQLNETVGVDNYSSSIILQKTTNSGVTVFNRHFYFYLIIFFL